MENNVASFFPPVSDVQILSGVIPSIELVNIFQAAPGAELQRTCIERFKKVFFVIAMLEGALDEDYQINLCIACAIDAADRTSS
jgi:hypothetical protein